MAAPTAAMWVGQTDVSTAVYLAARSAVCWVEEMDVSMAVTMDECSAGRRAALRDAMWVGLMVASTAENWVALLVAVSDVVMADSKAVWRDFPRVDRSVVH